MENFLELALGLQHSNEPSVAELAKAYIVLHSQYQNLERDFDMLEDDLGYIARESYKVNPEY